MTQIRSVSRWLLPLLLLAFLVTACGPTGASTGSNTAPGNTSKTATAADELTIATSADPGSWDPIDTFLLSWGMVANQIFDGLVFRGTDLKIQPGLATEWKWLDDKTLQFKLRKGVKFQDGEPFNAAAVKFTFDRLLGDEGKKSPQLGNYKSIDHVQVVDDYTVNFVMKVKDPVIITKLAGYGGMIVPPKYLQEKGDAYFDSHPIGTGPFKVTDYVRDDHVTMVANPDYFRGAPKVKKITYKFVPEATTRVAMLKTGEADIVQGIPVAQAATLKDAANISLLPVGSPTVSQLRINTKKPPFDNVKVRQAINYAIDTQTIIKTVLEGYGKPISTFQGDISFGNDPTLKPYPYDPTKAKQMLKDAGVKPGQELTIGFSATDSTGKEVVQAVKSYLEAVGFKVKLNPTDASLYWSKAIPQGTAGDMWTFGWGGWTLDFDNTAYLLYHKGEFWNPDFSDAQVEQLLTEERSTLDQNKRLEVFKQLDRRLQELAPEVDLYQVTNLWGASKRVQGFIAPPDDRMVLWNVSVSGK